MRKLRTLIAAVAAFIAIATLATPNTLAAVEVTNDGTIALEGRMDIDIPPESPGVRFACHVDLTMEVDANGGIYATDVDAYRGTYADWDCNVGPGTNQTWLNDYNCHNGSWYGQILGPGDEWESGAHNGLVVEYAGTGDFEAVIAACTYFDNNWSAPDLLLRFPINMVSGDEVWSLPEQPLWYFAPPGYSEYTITGFEYDEQSNHTALGIETVE